MQTHQNGATGPRFSESRWLNALLFSLLGYGLIVVAMTLALTYLVDPGVGLTSANYRPVFIYALPGAVICFFLGWGKRKKSV